MKLFKLILIFLIISCTKQQFSTSRNVASFQTCYDSINCLLDQTVLTGEADLKSGKIDNLTDLEKNYGNSSMFELQKQMTVEEIAKNNEKINKLLMDEKITKSNKFPKNALSFTEANQIYQRVLNSGQVKNLKSYDPENKIGFCFGKATIAHMESLLIGLNPKSIKKIWRVGGFSENYFSHHVALMVRGESGSWLVLDPLLGKLTDSYLWQTRFGGKESMTFITRPERFGPSNADAYSKIELFGTQTENFCRTKDCYNGFFHDYFNELDDRLAKERARVTPEFSCIEILSMLVH